MLSSQICVLSIILFQASLGEAGLRGGQAQPQVSEESVETSLVKELSGASKGGANGEHISRLEEGLRPMYTALKEEDGSLSHKVVRYILHRFFTHKYGWVIRGLEPGSTNDDPKSGDQTMENSAEWVASYLQNYIEQLQGGRGISLRELAVLAATLEELIHKEAVTRLEMTFNALELPEGTLLDHNKLHESLEVYMMIYMLGGNFTVKGAEDVLRAHKIFTEHVKDWNAQQDWMHAIQVELFPKSDDQALDFGSATRVVEEIGRRYATYKDIECGTLKSQLLSIESTKAGRVRLTEFYKASLGGMFEFTEKQEYLRSMGVLDESNASDPHVIVPNYVASRPNCDITSKFYVVCCRNECEDLLSALESKFQSPTAKPDQILEQVAGMSSETVAAPRKLSDSLVQRLNKLAQANNGVVPLHGRLFAQWMHHAFPRECPYPHQAGTTSPQTPDEWMQATGQTESKKTVEEINTQVEEDTCTAPKGEKAREHHDLKENELPWDDSEELLRPVAPVREVLKLSSEAAAEAQATEPPSTRLAPPRHVTFFSTLPSLLAKLATFVSIAFVLAFMAWKLTASGKEVEPMNPITFIQMLLSHSRRSSKALESSHMESLC